MKKDKIRTEKRKNNKNYRLKVNESGGLDRSLS